MNRTKNNHYLFFIIIALLTIGCAINTRLNKNFLQSRINKSNANDLPISNSFDGIETNKKISLNIIGEVPSWIKGTFIRNGPGKFKFNNEHIAHWFDGFALLISFNFDNGKILYQSTFLKSDQFLESIQDNEIKLNGFANKYAKLKMTHTSLDGQQVSTSNANINVEKIQDHIVALGETPMPVEFQLDNLNTIGFFDYKDNLKKSNTWECAHLKRDPIDSSLYGFMIKYGWNSDYLIYKIDANSSERKIIAKKSVPEPSYMHDFSITKNYIILTAYPLIVSGIDLLRPNLSFIGAHRWEPERQTHILIFNKTSGTLVADYIAPAMFAFHHINAYENKEQQVILYVTASDNADLVIKTGVDIEKPLSHTLKKITIDISNSTVSVKELSSETYDLPRINDKFIGQENKFFYSVSFNPNKHRGFGITKYNLEKNITLNWFNENHFAGEPIFIPKPGSVSEDDGVLLSIIYNNLEKVSYLLILDAKTMHEIGRAFIPQIIPLGLHGRFF